MTQELLIIRMNIAHYEAQLKLDMDDGKRAVVTRLLAEAKENLVLATDFNKKSMPRSSSAPYGPHGFG